MIGIIRWACLLLTSLNGLIQLMMDMVRDVEKLMPHRDQSYDIPLSQEQPPSQPVGTQEEYIPYNSSNKEAFKEPGHHGTRYFICGRNSFLIRKGKHKLLRFASHQSMSYLLNVRACFF